MVGMTAWQWDVASLQGCLIDKIPDQAVEGGVNPKSCRYLSFMVSYTPGGSQ